MAISAESIRAAGVISFAHGMERLRLFDVADWIVQSWQQGLLPLANGASASRALHEYWRRLSERMSAADRRDIYQRVLGAPGGNPNAETNQAFDGLWARFIASVSAYDQQTGGRWTIGRAARLRLARGAVARAGRDLAENLSLYGYGMVYAAATQLQDTIEAITSILSEQEIQVAFGVHDRWQVIDHVSRRELGGQGDTARLHGQAAAGAAIFGWLASHAEALGTLACLWPPPVDATLIDAVRGWLATA